MQMLKLVLVLVLLAIAMVDAGYKCLKAKKNGKAKHCKDVDGPGALSEDKLELKFKQLLRELDEEDDKRPEKTRPPKAPEKLRRKLFKSCVEKAKAAHNNDNVTYDININSLCLRTPTEMNNMKGLRWSKRLEEAHQLSQKLQDATQGGKDRRHRRQAAPSDLYPPTSDRCAATGPVENQGNCGSCWAFTASHALTARMYLRDQRLNAANSSQAVRYGLSEQQPTDCAYARSGCEGGLPNEAWKHYARYAAADDANYPYTRTYQGRGKCAETDGRLEAHLQVNRYEHDPLGRIIEPKNIDQMKAAVHGGTVAVGIVFTPSMSYVGDGVFTTDDACAAGKINHGMVVCGYGRDEVTGKEYWMVKNSWGPYWGQDGYIKIELGKNICRIEEYVWVPLLDYDKETRAPSSWLNRHSFTCEVKSCLYDSECGNKICKAHMCDCQNCQTGTACDSDRDCGGTEGACDQNGVCSCDAVISECVEERLCTSDVACGGVAGSCQDTGLFSSDTLQPIKRCRCSSQDCADGCVPDQQCSVDLECGDKVCHHINRRCDCQECSTGTLCYGFDRFCGNKEGACQNDVCNCEQAISVCVQDRLCRTDVGCAGVAGACQPVPPGNIIDQLSQEQVKTCVCTANEIADEYYWQFEPTTDFTLNACLEGVSCESAADCGDDGSCEPDDVWGPMCAC